MCPQQPRNRNKNKKEVRELSPCKRQSKRRDNFQHTLLRKGQHTQ